MTLIDHVLRVHVRVDFGGDVETIRSGTDMCLPATSSLAETLPDILSLVNAPNITVPWEGFTGAGTKIDPGKPLHTQGLTQGSVLIIAPQRPAPAMIAKDSAEALSDLSQVSPKPSGTQDAAAVAGFIGLAVAFLLAPIPAVGNTWRCLLLIITATAVLSWRRNSALFVSTVAFAGASAWWAVLSPRDSLITAVRNTVSPTDGGLAMLSAGAAMIAISVVLQVLRKHHLSVFSACCTTGALTVASAPGAWIFTPGFNIARYGWVFSVAGCGITVALLLLAFSPTISCGFAGLKVPRLPSAGQDLSISDETPSNPDEQAQRAAHILDGMLAGLAGFMIPALCAVGISGGGFNQALCITAGASVLIHAHRHYRIVAVWATWLIGLTALICCAIAADNQSLPMLIIACLACTILASSPLWSTKISALEPTTIVWIERLESLCIAASVPLALHIAGTFILIRGLG